MYRRNCTGAPQLKPYAEVIKALPDVAGKQGLLTTSQREPLLVDDTLACTNGETSRLVDIYYAPFDFVNERARVVIVGISPSKQSMWAALSAARDALNGGASLADAAKQGKLSGTFSNM